jgi:CRISPR-associated protein Csd1
VVFTVVALLEECRLKIVLFQKIPILYSLYMRQFSQTPFRTWELIRRNTQIYLNQLKPGSREFYKNLYGQIMQLFEEGCFEEKKALDGKFLLGYDCQREALKYRQKDNITISTEDEPENNDEEE